MELVLVLLVIIIGGIGIWNIFNAEPRPSYTGDWIAQVYLEDKYGHKKVVFRQRYSSADAAKEVARRYADKVFYHLIKRHVQGEFRNSIEIGNESFGVFHFYSGVKNKSLENVSPVDEYNLKSRADKYEK